MSCITGIALMPRPCLPNLHQQVLPAQRRPGAISLKGP